VYLDEGHRPQEAEEVIHHEPIQLVVGDDLEYLYRKKKGGKGGKVVCPQCKGQCKGACVRFQKTMPFEKTIHDPMARSTFSLRPQLNTRIF
jgi:hypothetical protein